MRLGFVTALFLGVLTRVNAEAVQAPFRVKVNTEIFKKAVNSRDQEVFKTFENTHVPDFSGVTDISFSLSPQSGDVKDFDFDLSVAKDDVGAGSKKL